MTRQIENCLRARCALSISQNIKLRYPSKNFPNNHRGLISDDNILRLTGLVLQATAIDDLLAFYSLYLWIINCCFFWFANFQLHLESVYLNRFNCLVIIKHCFINSALSNFEMNQTKELIYGVYSLSYSI